MKYLVDANVLSEPTRSAPDPAVLDWLQRNERELAVDPIIDMGRTAVNVAGQTLVPMIVAKREGILGQEEPVAREAEERELVTA